MLFALLREELRGHGARRPGERDRHRLVTCHERALVADGIGGAERVGGADPDGRLEQDDTRDALGESRCELEQDAPAEAVPDPGCAVDACRSDGLEHVVDVRLEAPRRFPPRATVTAEVRSEHAKPREPLRQVRKARTVRGDTVQAHDRRQAGVPPFVLVQLHTRSSKRS